VKIKGAISYVESIIVFVDVNRWAEHTVDLRIQNPEVHNCNSNLRKTIGYIMLRTEKWRGFLLPLPSVPKVHSIGLC